MKRVHARVSSLQVPMIIQRILLLLALLATSSAHALTAGEARAIAAGETDARIEALNRAVTAANERTAAFIQALWTKR